jgi:hypothetical protein
MSEIFVEEENTVYELDAECLKRKEEQKRRQRDSKEIRNKNSYHAQKTKAICRKQNQPKIWILCLLFLIVR